MTLQYPKLCLHIPGMDSRDIVSTPTRARYPSFFRAAAFGAALFNMPDTWSDPTSALRPELRRFAAVSPFCFGYPAQPDIASWRIRIIMIRSTDAFLRHSTPGPIDSRIVEVSWGFLLHPSCSGLSFGFQGLRHDARAPLEREQKT